MMTLGRCALDIPRHNHSSNPRRSGSVSFLLLIVMMLSAMPRTMASQDELDEELWFSDWENEALEVNEGELTLLDEPPEKQAHQHLNHLIIDSESIESGWVGLQQCHRDIDKVPALQITFAAGKVRDLEITSSENIGRSWVEGHTVQLVDVGDDSSLCLSARTRGLKPGDETVVLSNGPYMRRFLDGFYPMRVKLRVSYPGDELQFNQASPVEFEQLSDDEILLDVWFEGELRTTVFFDRI